MDYLNLGNTAWGIFYSTVTTYALFAVAESIRRLWFHPLSKYPGPRLAAMTLWWQCYYDVFHDGGGQLLAQLELLHKKYGMISACQPSRHTEFEIGPVLRIGPNHVRLQSIAIHHAHCASQLHFSEPKAYLDIYSPGSTFRKDPDFYEMFFINESSFSATDRRIAKHRRDVLLPLISRKALRELESVIQDKVA
jgi:hypothetical protein